MYNRWVPPKAAAPTPNKSSAINPQAPARNGAATQDGRVVNRSAHGLYARYIPESSSKNKLASSNLLSTTENSINANESKHEAKRNSAPDVHETPPKKRKRAKLAAETGSPVTKKRKEIIGERFATKNDEKRKQRVETAAAPEPLTDGQRKKGLNRKEKRIEKQKQSLAESSGQEAEKRSRSHTKMLSKYQTSARKPAENAARGEEVDEGNFQEEPEQPPQVNQLEPIPSPRAQQAATASWSALPGWFTEPLRIPLDAASSFDELPGISDNLRTALKTQGFKQALPVQTGVLPLLLPHSVQHLGDVCVSATTGSGKTLSYVLPLMEQLRRLPAPLLRAVIVVPTRELVSQVQQTCDAFSATCGHRIGTAVGNRSLKDEQELLVDRRMHYDPGGYETLRKRFDRQFGNEALDDEELEDEEMLLGLGSLSDVLPLHVPVHYSKVDILVTTPGRLVEHIRSTKGFSLAHLQWLVIDEADRLLDQSFQDWADVLNSAIDTEPIIPMEMETGLEGLELPPRKPPVRKILLSATMTSDLEKLSLLKLRNPRLVVVQGSETLSNEDAIAKGEQAPIGGVLSLPPTLGEHAIPVGDGSEKPLYLIRLLEKILGVLEKPKPAPKMKSATSKTRIDTGRDSEVDDSEDSSSVSSSSVSSVSSSSVSSVSSNTSSSSSHSEPSSASTEPEVSAQPTISQPPSILIFTSTNEATSRLHALLAHLLPSMKQQVASLTRTTSAAQTTKLLARLRAGTLRVLIASDRASRGLDVPVLTDVISYDIPRSVTAYVHRMGRTARAGRRGTAWTLTERRGAAWFWHVVARGDAGAGGRTFRKTGADEDVKIRRADGQKVRKTRLEGVGEGGMRERYQEALDRLRKDVLGRS